MFTYLGMEINTDGIGGKVQRIPNKESARMAARRISNRLQRRVRNYYIERILYGI